MKTKNQINSFMKKFMPFTICLVAFAFVLAYAQPVPRPFPTPPPESSSGRYVWVEATNSLSKFDLDFPGGTPKDLVKAIEKATDKPLNTVIPDEYANLKIPAVSVKNVTVAELFAVLKQASRKNARYAIDNGNGVGVYGEERTSEYGFSTQGALNDNSIWFFSWDGEPGPFQRISMTVCRFYQVSPYLEAGYKVDDITTTIETGWKMLGITNPPVISYHKDTKVLIVVGKQDQVDLVGDALKQLSTTKLKEKSKTGEAETSGK